MSAPRNPQFNVRIHPELKEKVAALAERNKRSINAEIVAALEAWVEAAFTTNPAGSLTEIARSLEGLKLLIEKQQTPKQ
ncbi:Arc family DNA-binding protein [Dickeya poaceiphila]|uniref:Arc family DNA-binding protein n=1 Tax=Dickeya poaceiphila TaxID=568768 RepID=A0A5B8IDK3_9GAMM|nr:Arc family DNA-binding protein [Dickeya poaceiphila]QDX31943.1 Arc family DNA-binding protein [Dickeya poaceiphila]